MIRKLMEGLRPGWGRTGNLAPLLVAAGISLAPVIAGAQSQTSVPTLRPNELGGARGAETASLSPLPDGGASSITLPQIFDLQRAGQFRDAEAILGWVNDHRLLGHVMAQRYLSSSYHTTYPELAGWLQLYADHPEAPRVYALALKRRPAGSAAPQRPQVDLFQSGTTDDSSIAGDSRWRTGLVRWRKHDLDGAATAFESLAQSAQDSAWDKATAAYWAARAHLKNREPEKVSAWLKVAAQYPRTFYGQLARAALGLDSSFDWSMKPLTPAGVRAVGGQSGGERRGAVGEDGGKV